ncbi:MAG: hypothetical protein ACI8TQ_000275 [Planctomycetota bacterium]|jgi:hypothetical protein
MKRSSKAKLFTAIAGIIAVTTFACRTPEKHGEHSEEHSEHPAGDKEHGEHPEGEHPSSEHPAGEHPSSEHPNG